MKLIIVLICLGVQRYLNINFSLADYNWFKPYSDLLKGSVGKMLNGYVGVAIVVLPVVIVVWLLSLLFSGVVFGLLSLVISIGVLFYCMDGRDLSGQLSAYLGGSENKASAEVAASEANPKAVEGSESSASPKAASADQQVADFLNADVPTGQAETARAITTAVFTKSLHFVFSVLFWFLLLGTFGALLYFMVATIQQYADQEFPEMKEANGVVLGVLDWVPVRLLGLSMALVGSFAAVFGRWMKSLTAGIEQSNQFATDFGLSALGKDSQDVQSADVEENKSALELVFRSLVVWVVVVAVLTIVAFVS